MQARCLGQVVAAVPNGAQTLGNRQAINGVWGGQSGSTGAIALQQAWKNTKEGTVVAGVTCGLAHAAAVLRHVGIAGSLLLRAAKSGTLMLCRFYRHKGSAQRHQGGVLGSGRRGAELQARPAESRGQRPYRQGLLQDDKLVGRQARERNGAQRQETAGSCQRGSHSVNSICFGVQAKTMKMRGGELGASCVSGRQVHSNCLRTVCE